jgi:hypothetical protein
MQFGFDLKAPRSTSNRYHTTRHIVLADAVYDHVMQAHEIHSTVHANILPNSPYRCNSELAYGSIHIYIYICVYSFNLLDHVEDLLVSVEPHIMVGNRHCLQVLELILTFSPISVIKHGCPTLITLHVTLQLDSLKFVENASK